MNLSTLDMIAIILSSTIMLTTIGILVFANHVLIKQERALRERFKEYRDNCAYSHVERPF
jgi:protein-S-isoprenylcysteine O-methyltransferase Ste14